MRCVSVATAVLVSFFIVGCPMVDWKELQFTRHKPAEADLIGTWRATAATVKDIRGRGHYPAATHEIILRGDHTFSLRNMPDWWSNGFGESHRQLESGDGTWEIEPARDVWQIWVVRLHFPSLTTWINLYRQKPPYLIFVRVGDPNNGDAMFFERATKT
jgi:hypothetical protein